MSDINFLGLRKASAFSASAITQRANIDMFRGWTSTVMCIPCITLTEGVLRVSRTIRSTKPKTVLGVWRIGRWTGCKWKRLQLGSACFVTTNVGTDCV